MGLQKQNILNRLVNEVPEGLPVTGSWLKEHIGCSRQLVQVYIKNNWLANPCRGVYVRNISKMTWLSALLSLQHICKLDCYPSGKTALHLHGFVQYLQIGNEFNVTLRGTDSPPSWLEKLRLSTSFQYNGRQLFNDSNVGFTEYPLHGFSDSLRISSVPRAFLEVLAEVFDKNSFYSAYEIFEGMTSISPSLVHELLTNCRNIKVKRLFFVMLEKAGHQWGKKLNANDYYFGSGKRLIVKGGGLHSKYKITVPVGFND